MSNEHPPNWTVENVDGDVVKKYSTTFHKDKRILGNKVVDDKDELDELLMENRRKRKYQLENMGVLVIYSGGTIGSAPKDKEDPNSPQVVKEWTVLRDATPALYSAELHALNFRIDAIAFDEPLDSAKVGPPEWNVIAQILEHYMDKYEGFVIAHGTDTLVYTASALSFMLENLKKPVILTGSQLSAIDHVRNDANQNLITSLLIANAEYGKLPTVPEVCIFFRDRLLRGNRSIKMDASGFAAYSSPNCPPLGRAGSSIEIDESLLLKRDKKTFRVNKFLNTNVVALRLFPGIQDTDYFEGIAGLKNRKQKLRAIVMQTFGAGNTATDKDFLDQIKNANNDGMIVFNVTQCPHGRVEMGLYETSAVLIDCGVISGWDITAEAALTKLMVLLGNENLNTEEVKIKAQTILQGEQSLSIQTTRFERDQPVLIGARAKDRRYRITPADVPAFDHEKISSAVLAFHNASFEASEENKPVQIKIFCNLSARDEIHEKALEGTTATRQATGDSSTLVFDITKAAKQYLDGGEKNSFTVVIDTEDCDFEWNGVDLTLFLQP